MATVTIATRPATMPAPLSKKVKPNKKGSDEGLKHSRLRLDGKTATKEQIQARILEHITKRAMKPKELAKVMNFSRQHIYNYCEELKAEGKIEKDGQAWKLKGLSAAAVVAQKIEELSKKEFCKVPVMQEFLAAVKRQPSRQEQFATFRSICFGRVLPGWKMHPGSWREPETTDAFIQAYKEHFGVKDLPRHIRMALRSFIMYALHIQLEKSEAKDRGLSGEKDNAGAHKHVKLYDDQIHKGLDMLEGDNEIQALFACWTEGFPRPERGLLIELDTFEFGKRDLQFAYVKGENKPVIDQHTVQILRMQNEAHKATIRTFATMLRAAGVNVPENADIDSDLVRFETVAKNFATFRVQETKTGKPYQKFMVDQRKIEIVKAYVEKRKAAGFRYLFYDGKEDVSESQEGRLLAKFAQRTGLYAKLRNIYTTLGKGEGYFDEKPAYTLRHIGAHVWLRRTNYNYGIVTAMGWDSADTLMGFYGGMDEKHLLDTAINALAGVTSGAFAAVA